MGEKIKKAFIPYFGNDFKPSILKPRTLFKLAVVLLILKSLVFLWLFYFPQTNQFAVVTSSRLIELTNNERVSIGLEPLQINEKLIQAAQQKAQDMLNKNYFEHTSPSGITPWYWLDIAGYNYKTAGENLAKDFTESLAVHQAWMNSSSHRKNILNNKYKEIGIAVIDGEIDGKRTVLAVQFFALSAVAPTGVGAKAEPVEKPKPLVVSNTEIEIEVPTAVGIPTGVGEVGKIESLKGPDVFKQESLEMVYEKSRSVLGAITEKSESFFDKFYFTILAILGAVLLLTIFINIKVQYPGIILAAVFFIIVIAVVALFNIQGFLNKGIDVVSIII